VGVGEDASFDLELINRFGCEVYAFDPTPRSIEYVHKQLAGFPAYHFTPIGLWKINAKVRMFAPLQNDHVSHSITNFQSTSTYIEVECRNLRTIMKSLGHAKLHLLKLDIEGAEFEVIKNILFESIQVDVLCVEYHPSTIRQILASIRSMLTAGYEVVAREGWNYTFVTKERLQIRAL
jgi:FkbM family methyltransferase